MLGWLQQEAYRRVYVKERDEPSLKNDEVERTFTITARRDVMDRITALLATMRWLGGIGASREIKFGWDGDGHERFNMDVNGLDQKLDEFIDPCQFVEDKEMCDEAGTKNIGL